MLCAMLGCSYSRIPPPSPNGSRAPVRFCGTPETSIAQQLAVGFIAATLLGGVVAIGYVAIGGDVPLHSQR
jgi:hypothetical protein